jgi:hypothetical protein
MEPIPNPALVRHEDRRVQVDFGQEHQIFVHPHKSVLEAPEAHDSLPSEQEIGGTRSRCLSQKVRSEEAWRLVDGVDLNARLRNGVSADVLGVARPTGTVQGASVDHRYLGMVLEETPLLLQFMRKPNVISIQQGYVFAIGSLNTKVTRGAYSSIPMTLVLQIMYFFRPLFGVSQGNHCATVRRAIIHQQKLPLFKGLSEDALNSLFDKPLRVQESNDYRDCRPINHHYVEVPFFAAASQASRLWL